MPKLDPERAEAIRQAMTKLERRIGERGGPEAPGSPTLIAIGGLHGNEPAGVLAIQRVLDILDREGPHLAGRFVGLAGNLPALAAGLRFIDRDLNRSWQSARVAELRAHIAAAATAEAGPETADSVETRQQIELLTEIDAAIDAADGLCVVIDLHTTSSQSAPFILFADTLANRAFALHFPLPLVLGLEEQVEGALLDEVEGHDQAVTLGVEGGQHDDPAAVDNLESVIWLALVTAGCLAAEAVPGGVEPHHRRLALARGRAPRVLEVRHRHGIQAGDDFRMEPGFENFDAVDKGDLLAHDRFGPIRAVERGRILMPLYQGQGEDGFFLTRKVRPMWLRVSELLRRRQFGRLLPILPGVRPHQRLPQTLVIDTRVARFFPLQILHLLGYRKQRLIERKLVVSRRVNDHRRARSAG